MILALTGTAFVAWLAGLATPRLFKLVPTKPKQPCPWCKFGLSETPIRCEPAERGMKPSYVPEKCECCERWVMWNQDTSAYMRWDIRTRDWNGTLKPVATVARVEPAAPRMSPEDPETLQRLMDGARTRREMDRIYGGLPIAPGGQ